LNPRFSLISHSVPVCLFLCHLCSALVANKVLLFIVSPPF